MRCRQCKKKSTLLYYRLIATSSIHIFLTHGGFTRGPGIMAPPAMGYTKDTIHVSWAQNITEILLRPRFCPLTALRRGPNCISIIIVLLTDSRPISIPCVTIPDSSHLRTIFGTRNIHIVSCDNFGNGKCRHVVTVTDSSARYNHNMLVYTKRPYVVATNAIWPGL